MSRQPLCCPAGTGSRGVGLADRWDVLSGFKSFLRNNILGNRAHHPEAEEVIAVPNH
jgi:hypothetical protein